MSMRATLALLLLAGTALAAHAGDAIERKILQRHDLDVPGREAVMAEVHIPAGAREGRHTHAGTALAYVIEGEVSFEIEGAAPRTLKPGDSVVIEPGRVHEGINNGTVPVKLVATFVVEKGKPLTTPSP